MRLSSMANMSKKIYGMMRRSCLNLSNVICSIGMLYVSYVLSQGRWPSLVLFTMVGAICFHTGNLNDRCMC
ncbi:Os01g0586100 [Oryza sativa Japonica Group]|uniref:Os01g0586100 protein n=1 Tax=Oryza sativa subsp. japonica TaxID=39947 RepID=A0A0P0V4L1_ORYSJ|nr:Os01g0586100 [Oryza sativa Japonica Group]